MLNKNFNYEFQKVLKKYKNKTAIIDLQNNKFTFNFLDKNSDQIANYLIKKHEKGSVALIQSNKDICTFLAIIACLKAGFPYVMLDNNLPKARINHIISSSSSKFFLSTNKNHNVILKTYLINKVIKEKFSKNNKKHYNNVNENSIAYIMFTSGSTGVPKGAKISHKSLLIFKDQSKKNFKISQNDIFTQLNPLYFDNSIFDIFSSLLNGNTLVLFEKLNIYKPESMIRRIKYHKCTIWFSTPSLLIYLINMSLIQKAPFKSLKKIIFGGEPFPKDKLLNLYKKLKNKNFYNVYGPTECTCICSSYLIKEKDLNDESSMYVSLGKIWKPINYKILNKNKKRNKNGELILTGNSVAHGYAGNTRLTKKFFYNLNTKKRGYRTGDIVYEDKKNKNLYFVGRKDSQIKHMGHRIELNEIEVAINKIKGVKEVSVFYSKKNMGNIVAVLGSNNHKLTNEKINKGILKFLPKYFLPNHIFMSRNLPKNSNGKIDKTKIRSLYENKISH